MSMRNLTTVTAAVCVTMAMSSSWAGTANIGFAGYKGTETLTDFPALIKLPDCAAGFTYADAAANGADVYFTDAGGNVIPHDIDTWDAQGKSFVWVKVPSLTSATTITMHWGETPPADAPAATNTWSGYVGVWHMNAADGATATAEPDATGHGLAAVPTCRQPDGENTIDQIKPVEWGKVGNAYQNQTGSANSNVAQFQQGLLVPAHWDYVSDQTVFTVGGWFNMTRNVSYERLFSAQTDNGEATGWEAYMANNSDTTFAANGAGTGYKTANNTVASTSLIGRWTHIQFVFNGTKVFAYENGVLRKEMSIAVAKKRTDGRGFAIGEALDFEDAEWIGYIDEVRMYNGALSADRIRAEFATANDPVAFTGSTRTHSADLWCSGYTGSETLTDFPLYVKLPDCVAAFKYDDAAADGSDIYFTDAEGNVLASEIDAWHSSSDKSSFWVKVPSLTRNTKITMHWGGTPPASRPAASATWSGGYVGVWHMGSADGTSGAVEPDATGHGLDGVPAHGSDTNQIANLKTRSSGDYTLVGQCQQNQAAAAVNKYNGLQVPSYDSYITNPQKMTVSGWFYFDGVAKSAYPRLFSAKKTNNETVGWEVWGNVYSTTSLGCTGSSSLNRTVTVPSFSRRWMYYMVVYDGTSAKVYVDGRLVLNTTVAAINRRTDGLGFTIGNDANLDESGLYGCYDEVRMYDGAVSADRAFAEYFTQAKAALFLREKPAAEATFKDELPCYGHDCNVANTALSLYSSVIWKDFGVELLPGTALSNAKAVGSPHKRALTTIGNGPYGTGLDFGSGDWTFHVRARMENVENGIVWSIGTVATADTGLLLLSDGTNGVSLVTVTNKVPVAGSRLEVAVPGATTGYHDYAAVFNASTKVVSLYVDGVMRGTLPHPNFKAANGQWQFFDPYGAAVAGLSTGRGIRIDEYRFYRRALTAAEMADLNGWNTFDPSMRRVFTASVSNDMSIENIDWTPAKPADGFRTDDLLEVEFTAPDKSLYLSSYPAVAGLTVRGCTGAAEGAAGRLVITDGAMKGDLAWIKLERGVSYDLLDNNCSQYDSPLLVFGDGCRVIGSARGRDIGRAQMGNGVEFLPGATVTFAAEQELGVIGWNYVPVWLDLNGGTLVKTGLSTCWIANTYVSGAGTIDVREGTLSAEKTQFSCPDASVNVGDGATFHSSVPSKIGELLGDGAVTMSANSTNTVSRRLSGRLDIGAASDSSVVKLADGATLDLSANEEPFVQTSGTVFAGEVKVALPSGVAKMGRTKLISWSEPPEECVTFSATGTSPRVVRFESRSDGLYLYRPGMMIIVK